MTSGSRLARPGQKIAAPLLAAVVLLAAGAHLWLNTNLFGRDEVCGGLVSTGSAQTVLGSGRVSDRNGLDDRPGERLDFTCTVESTSFLTGSDTERLNISVSRERGDFPFTDNGRWPSPARMSFVSGETTGAVGADHGWVLLPGSCSTADGPAVVEGYAPQGSDRVALIRILTEVAGKAAERASCAAERSLVAPDTVPAPPKPRQVGDDAVCGLTGLVFPGRPEDRDAAMERVQDGTGPTWSCEVEEHAVYSVTREPRLVAGITASPGFSGQPRVAGRKVSGFDDRHVVADCGGVPTYFSLELGQEYTSAAGAPGTPRLQALFTNFVDVAGKRFGCSAQAP